MVRVRAGEWQDADLGVMNRDPLAKAHFNFNIIAKDFQGPQAVTQHPLLRK